MQFSTDYDAAQRLAFAKHPEHCKRDTPAHELAPTWHNISFAGSILTIGLRRGKNNPPPNPHLSDILSKYQHRVFGGFVPRVRGGRLGGGRNSCPRRSSSAARSRRSHRAISLQTMLLGERDGLDASIPNIVGYNHTQRSGLVSDLFERGRNRAITVQAGIDLICL